MSEPVKERQVIEIFQRRRRQCGLAAFLFLATIVYLGLLFRHCRGTLTPCDPFLDIPVFVHVLLVVLAGFGSFLFIVESFRCPNCDVIPRAPGEFYVYKGPEYTFDPEKCHNCGIRLRERQIK